MEKKFSFHSDVEQKALLKIPATAQPYHDKIVQHLQMLESSDSSCCSTAFKNTFQEIYSLFETYQNTVINNSSYRKTCRRGCAYCCFHWVEDVNSFEAEIISEYLKSHAPHKIDTIILQCKEDQQILENIESLTIDKLHKNNEIPEIDQFDLALSVFYQMQRPCPLLLETGACSIYSIRPLTCRIYMSFSEPEFCHPNYQDDEDIPTYLLNLEENANSILDRLHFKYQKFPEDTGLRSLLIKYLSNK
jgi:Fe-S-cluster containining protein